MENNKFRCHPTIIIEEIWKFLIAIAVYMFFSVDDIIRMFQEGFDEAWIVIAIVLVVAILVLAYKTIIFMKTWISVSEDTLIVERLTLKRTKNTIGIKNISNINLEQNIFERFVGTCTVKLDTNSQSTANETDVRIVLKKDKAEAFRRYLLGKMNGENRKQESELPERCDVSYTEGEVAMHCLYSLRIYKVLFLIAVVAGSAILISKVSDGTVTIENIVAALGGMMALAGVVISVARSLVKDYFTYYGFRATRVKDRIYLTYGLLKKRQYVVPIDKINAVQVESSLISRILGRQSVKLICIGLGDEDNENSFILLSEKRLDSMKKLALLLPEYDIREPEMIRRRLNTMWSEVTTVLAWAIIEVILLFVLKEVVITKVALPAIVWYGAIVAAGVFNAFLGIRIGMKLHTEGIYVGDKALIVSMGSFGRIVTWIAYRRIQHLEFEEGIMARRFGYAKGHVQILAKMTDSIHLLPAVSESVYRSVQMKISDRRSGH